MRTRFLATDYSTAASGAAGGPIQSLDFVRLPLPHFAPPNYPSFSANLLRSFDEIPVVGVSSEIDKLPIDDALSMFLSDVLPHFVDRTDFEDWRCEERSEATHTEEKYGTESNSKAGNGLKLVQFEIPEMDISFLPLQKSSIHSQMVGSQIFTEVSDTEYTMDSLNSDIRVHNHLEIQQSIYSVDDMNVEYSVEQKADLLEDAVSVQGELKSGIIKFPLFEVNVENLGLLGKTYIQDELLNFENIEKQPLAQQDAVISQNNKLLGSMEFDLVKYLLHSCVETQDLGDTKVSSQLETISIIELSYCQEYSTFRHVEPNDDPILKMVPINYDELMFLDYGLYHFSEVLSDAAKETKVETCESMFGEAMNFRSFNEMIVCHELILMDDTFISLPAPIFSDHGSTSSLHTLVDELLAQLDWQSSSASDGLYLDWHFLEDDCESVKHSSSWKMLWEIDTYNIDAAMNSSDNSKVIFDFIISEGHSNKPKAENYKETLNLSSSGVDVVHTSSGKADSNSLRNHGEGKRISEDVSLKTVVEKVPIFGESMSSDLEFFLNPRNYNTARETIPVDKSIDTNTLCQVLMSSDDSAANASTGVQQKWNVKLHHVHLSDNILLVIDYLRKIFLAILENDKELIHMGNEYQVSNALTLLQLPKEKLKRYLQEKSASTTCFDNNDDDNMVLTMLCAIKQMAFYLCYYGIQATYLYIEKLSSGLQFVKSRLSSLYNLVRDENTKAEKELSIVHPSISVLKEILQTRLSNCNSKFLVVSDQVFRWPLKRLLNSLEVSYSELEHCFTSTGQQHKRCDITDTIVDIMLNSDCCLASHDYVSASFPFSKFSFIVEYGGSNGSSRISSICPKSDGLPGLYFLKVELEELSIAKALCHGIDMPKKTQKESKNKLEDLLDTIPLKETYGNKHAEAVTEAEDSSKIPVQALSFSTELEKNLSCKPFCPETIIIVNTRNFNEEMVISRRSTYQRILEMEQEGTQVVERDICLPVDIIVSSAVSLTWYDCRNIRKKASALDEAFSCLPLCIESIAANILTSLSFAFSCCILIFEGECNFLGSIMESSDELYAAAASLGIDIQLFCSYSSDMTEEIILSCIKVAAKSSRGIFPKISDSETIAESFLTAFPSINPLSAHAVLSSDAILGKFLELSNGNRISALKKYQVHDESISLLNTVIKFGEREDSKSGMTDCSSSVSAPDSGNVHFESASDRKKTKYTYNLYNDGKPPSDLFHIGSLNQRPDDHNVPKVYLSHDSWLSGNAEISDKLFGLSFDDKVLGHSHEVDVDMMRPIDKLSLYDFPVARDFEISDKETPWMPRVNKDSKPRSRSDTPEKNNFRRSSIKVPNIPQENFIGEVIDVDDTLTHTEKFSVANSGSFSPFLLDAEIDYAARNSRMSKIPIDATNLPMFRNPDDIRSAHDVWISTKDNRQNYHQGLAEEDIVQRTPEKSHKQTFQENNNTRTFGSTPLSNALHSTHLRQGSPWTIEFLNRIREKSRLRQQSVSYDLSSPSFGSSGNATKAAKRKSPSILEFYKYEGGSTPQKIVDQKRQKRSSQPINSVKNKNASAPCPSSWTPADKRSRRTLSFSSNGNGGQSKLVWSDNNSRNSQRRL